MFTGIVEAIGRVVEVTSLASSCRLRIQTPFAEEVKPGDSVAVNGVCLTAVTTDEIGIYADVGPETARVTTLGALQRGQPVNLERPLAVNGRFDGHFVLGHVDGVGTIEEIRPDAENRWVTISFPHALAPYFIPKGSIAVDGVSLTIVTHGEWQFDVQVIPFTWKATTLSTLRKGDKVNLECDLIGKYIMRAVELAKGSAFHVPQA
jgi:riboflavin synthase